MRRFSEYLQKRQKNAEVMRAECFVSGALGTVLRLSRFAGIAPLRFVKTRTGWRVSVSDRFTYYGYFIITVILLITAWTTFSDLRVEQSRSVRMRTNTRRVVFLVDVTLMMLIGSTSVYRASTEMSSTIACLNHVQKINQELNIHHWPSFNERGKVCFFFVWLTGAATLFCIDQYLLTISTSHIDSIKWINGLYSFYYYAYCILQLYEMQLIFILLHVMYSFRAINDRLRSLLHDIMTKGFYKLPLLEPFNLRFNIKKKNKSMNKVANFIAVTEKNNSEGVIKSTPHHENIHRLALVYASACDVVREVDSCHGLVLLLMLGSFLYHLICSPYYLINYMLEDISKSYWIHVFNVVLQLLWCLYHAINLMMIVEPCHLTHIEMEHTRELVSHLMRCAHSAYDPLAVELELFFRHLILNRASYAPLKVAMLQRALVTTILGSITTYLVVIVQL